MAVLVLGFAPAALVACALLLLLLLCACRLAPRKAASDAPGGGWSPSPGGAPARELGGLSASPRDDAPTEEEATAEALGAQTLKGGQPHRGGGAASRMSGGDRGHLIPHKRSVREP